MPNAGARLAYLAGYVKRTALSNKRLLADEEGRITFGYTESGTGERRTLTLPAMEFLRRVLSHVLPPGLHRVKQRNCHAASKVRYGACPELVEWGWLHPTARRRFLIVQTLLAVPLTFKAGAEEEPMAAHLRCPHCGKYRLVLIARLPRIRNRPP